MKYPKVGTYSNMCKSIRLSGKSCQFTESYYIVMNEKHQIGPFKYNPTTTTLILTYKNLTYFRY